MFDVRGTDELGSCSLSSQGVDAAEAALTQDFQLFTMDDDFDAHYGLLAPEQTVIVRAYSDDSDDQVLQEVKPRFIVMYEPNLEFIRRIEVCLRRVGRFVVDVDLRFARRYIGTRTRGWVYVCTS